MMYKATRGIHIRPNESNITSPEKDNQQQPDQQQQPEQQQQQQQQQESPPPKSQQQHQQQQTKQLSIKLENDYNPLSSVEVEKLKKREMKDDEIGAVRTDKFVDADIEIFGKNSESSIDNNKGIETNNNNESSVNKTVNISNYKNSDVDKNNDKHDANIKSKNENSGPEAYEKKISSKHHEKLNNLPEEIDIPSSQSNTERDLVQTTLQDTAVQQSIPGNTDVPPSQKSLLDSSTLQLEKSHKDISDSQLVNKIIPHKMQDQLLTTGSNHVVKNSDLLTLSDNSAAGKLTQITSNEHALASRDSNKVVAVTISLPEETCVAKLVNADSDLQKQSKETLKDKIQQSEVESKALKADSANDGIPYTTIGTTSTSSLIAAPKSGKDEKAYLVDSERNAVHTEPRSKNKNKIQSNPDVERQVKFQDTVLQSQHTKDLPSNREQNGVDQASVHNPIESNDSQKKRPLSSNSEPKPQSNGDKADKKAIEINEKVNTDPEKDLTEFDSVKDVTNETEKSFDSKNLSIMFKVGDEAWCPSMFHLDYDVSRDADPGNSFYPCQIVDIRYKNSRKEISKDSSNSDQRQDPITAYYIHFKDSDRRLDRWVPAGSLKAIDDKSVQNTTKTLGPVLDVSFTNTIVTKTPDIPLHQTEVKVPPLGKLQDSCSKITRNRRRKIEELNPVSEREVGNPYVEAMEKIREEKTKVKNIDSVIFGFYHIDTWYFSPYPNEYLNCNILYICPYCLKYMKKKKTYVSHRSSCKWKHPPGKVIYTDPHKNPAPIARKVIDALSAFEKAIPSMKYEPSVNIKDKSNDDILCSGGQPTTASVSDSAPNKRTTRDSKNSDSTTKELSGPKSTDRSDRIRVYEVDGILNPLYCQNLCLLGKLFLDHKTLYFDVGPFLFYILTEESEEFPGHYDLVGYFSKEKEVCNSPFNLACIMILPPHQRKGYGNFIISLSYELSRIKGKASGPERPLSDLGQVSYRSYWTRCALVALKKKNVFSGVTPKDLENATGIKEQDLLTVLKPLGILTNYRGEYVVNTTQKTVLDALTRLPDSKIRLKPQFLKWDGEPCTTTYHRRNSLGPNASPELIASNVYAAIADATKENKKRYLINEVPHENLIFSARKMYQDMKYSAMRVSDELEKENDIMKKRKLGLNPNTKGNEIGSSSRYTPSQVKKFESFVKKHGSSRVLSVMGSQHGVSKADFQALADEVGVELLRATKKVKVVAKRVQDNEEQTLNEKES